MAPHSETMTDERSVAQRLFADLASLGDDALSALEALLDTLTRDELAALAYDWEDFWHRPKQWIPDGDWHTHGFLTSRRFGKMLDADTPIPVPSGWKRLGDLQVGDNVFDESGRPCHVLEIFDGTPNVAYRLRFSDHTTLDACSEHQWVTWTHEDRCALARSPYDPPNTLPEDWPSWRRLRARGNPKRAPRVYPDSQGPRVRTTQGIVDTLTRGEREEHNHSIPTAGALQCDEVDIAAIVDALDNSARGQVERALRAGPANLPTLMLRLAGAGATHDKTHVLYVIAGMRANGSVLASGKRPKTYTLTSVPQHRIDPYVIGAWLGDGSSAGAEITIGDEDLDATRDILQDAGAELGKARRPADGAHSATYPLGNGWLFRCLRILGLLGNKHVPAFMLRAAAPQRLALLQGLMDTDGYRGTSHVEFCSTNRALAEGVVELARSLGQRPVMSESRATLYGRDTGPKFRVTWRPTIQVFRMPRKAAGLSFGGAHYVQNHHRMIVSAERIAPKPMRCITVDSQHSLFLAGDGMIPTHNTRANSEFINREVKAGRAMRIGFMCQTEDLALQVMVNGDCGLIACSPPWFKAVWECGRVVWPNGAQAFRFTPEKPKNIRGDGVNLFWASEVQSWPGSGRDESMSNALIMASLGYGKLIWDGTPKRRHPLIRAMLLDAESDPQRYIVRTGVIEENRDNLRAGVIADLRRKLDGTQAGREELDGQYSDDDMGALWKQEWIDDNRRDLPPQLKRRIISVDPAISERAGTDQTGISELALGLDDQILIVGDMTDRYRPEEWGDLVIDSYTRGHCDCIVVERNRGGDLVVATIRSRAQSPERVRTGRAVTIERLELKAPTRWVPGVIYVKEINARGSKADRAGPVASMYQSGRISHVRDAHLDDLESLLTTWEPDPEDKKKGSPDRMDPMVHGVYELAGLWTEKRDNRAGFAGIVEASRQLSQPSRVVMPSLIGRRGGGNTI